MIKYGCIVTVGVILFAGVILRLAYGGPDPIGTGIDVAFLVIFIILTMVILGLRALMIETTPRRNPELADSEAVFDLQLKQHEQAVKEFSNGVIFAPVIVIIICLVGTGLLYLISQNPTVDQAIDAPRIINEWRSIVGAPPYVAP